MRQLALQIHSTAPPTLDNFIPGRNGEVLAALRDALASEDLTSSPHFLYWWGPAASGKSHLLQALAEQLRARGHQPHGIDAKLPVMGGLAGPLLLIDNVDRLSALHAEQVFHVWNAIHEQGGLLACTGNVAPAQLMLAPELTSRLAWGAVYRLQTLDDADRRHALQERAQALGLPISQDVLDYLLVHSARDLRTLLDLLAALDDFSLAEQRPVTIPLVRALLQARQATVTPLEPTKCD